VKNEFRLEREGQSLAERFRKINRRIPKIRSELQEGN